MTDYVQRFDKMSEDEQFALISALGNDDIMSQVIDGADDGVYTVKMIVNGVEVNAHNFMHRYIDAIDELARRRAEEMVRDKFQEMTQVFDPIKEMLDAAEANLSEKFGVKRDSWGYY